MDTKEAYSQLVQALKKQLDAEMPLAKEADDTLVAKGLLSNPSEAFELFTVPVDGYVDRIAEEVASAAHDGHRYTSALYQRSDEAALCDAIADLGFAQIQRKPVVKKAKPAGEYENAVAFVLGVYTCFVILLSQAPSGSGPGSSPASSPSQAPSGSGTPSPSGSATSPASSPIGTALSPATGTVAFTAADFTRLHKRAIYNYYLNHSSRQIRHLYDTGWTGKYAPRTIFYPLG